MWHSFSKNICCLWKNHKNRSINKKISIHFTTNFVLGYDFATSISDTWRTVVLVWSRSMPYTTWYITKKNASCIIKKITYTYISVNPIGKFYHGHMGPNCLKEKKIKTLNFKKYTNYNIRKRCSQKFINYRNRLNYYKMNYYYKIW